MIIQQFVHGVSRVTLKRSVEVKEHSCARFWQTDLVIKDRHGNYWELHLLSDYDAPPELDFASAPADQ